jgi:cyclohexadieny/prephenate dehydrogenase
MLSAMDDGIGTGDGRTWGTLGIAGVGLIGGSIAAAAKSRCLFQRVIGFGRSRERLEDAAARGLIDELAVDYAAASEVDLFVCCLPVDRIGQAVREAARHMAPGTVATDAGSAKAGICREIGSSPSPGVTFVGSHPLAGSEKQGFEHADANLFAGRICVVTPSGTDEPTLTRVIDFWQHLGCRVVRISPGEHDEILARTSHVPHVVAAAVAGGLREGEQQYAASGFRDVTRIAAGDPELWTGILLANRDAVIDEIGHLVERCGAISAALADADSDCLRRLLTSAKARRDAFASRFNHD